MIDVELAELKRQLTKEDSEKRKTGATFPHDIAPSVLLQKMLDIEAFQ